VIRSHEAGDEGWEYAEWLKEDAGQRGVDLHLVNIHMSDPMNPDVNHRKTYSLWDIYPHADFITYPILSEGFGNAFLEAVYFKKPLLINRYATFVKDIEPKGFELIVMDGYLTRKTVIKVKEVLESSDRRAKMVNTNFDVASQRYSYAILRRWLNITLTNFLACINSSQELSILTL
jgi:hypothetical protein